jgi:hypothetical protein
MNIEYENLRNTIKRKHSFKYRPEFSESFKTEINEKQIIPLIIEVFDKLEWPIVYQNEKSVEAKCQGNFSKLVGKLTIKKNNSGRIEVNSKSLEGVFFDFGKNSKRTGLFIALFKKLASEYKVNGKLVELETEYRKKNDWEDYEIPDELPKPKAFSKPNKSTAIFGGLICVVIISLIIGYLTYRFTYHFLLFEFGIGVLFGYLFGKVLKKSNILGYKEIKVLTISFLTIIFFVNHYIQYYLIVIEDKKSNLGFFELYEYLLQEGFMIDEVNIGWIGYLIIWVLQIVITFFISRFIILRILVRFTIDKIPEQVLNFTFFLFQKNKMESEIRAELAQKGWVKKSDQDDVFDAIATIIEINEYNRD